MDKFGSGADVFSTSFVACTQHTLFSYSQQITTSHTQHTLFSHSQHITTSQIQSVKPCLVLQLLPTQ